MCLYRFPLLLNLITLFLVVPLCSFAESKKNSAKIVPQPIQEMFQSNLVYPQEKDEIQFTLFPSFNKNQSGQKARTLFEVEYGITDAFQVIFEWDGGNRNDIYITPGTIYKLSKEWEIGIATPIGAPILLTIIEW